MIDGRLPPRRQTRRQTLEQYLDGVEAGFAADPADSDFQRGYKAAMDELVRVFCPHLRRKHGIGDY